MSKSLAELRTSPRTGLPERSYQLCVAAALVAEVESLMSHLEDIRTTELAQADGDESRTKPKRMGDSPESAKIRARLTEMQAELSEHTGTLTLRGVTEGEWRLWCDEHPARDEVQRDEDIAYGFCNADDLIDSLEKYAHAWNDEPLKAGDWAWLVSTCAPGDIRGIASVVVQMHETVVNLPKLLSNSLATLDAANGSRSPALSD